MRREVGEQKKKGAGGGGEEKERERGGFSYCHHFVPEKTWNTLKWL